jgi:XTP/dITP diphosphohydrolase
VGAAAPLDHLAQVMHRLRADCPWDRAQTHRSLTPYVIEETAEVVEAIEAGSDDQLAEELGDLLLQVVFHAEIAQERGAFSLGEVAQQVADKLVARHPYVFGDQAVPADPWASWERRKRAEKQRDSALDGIPDPLNTLARAAKAVTRIRSHAIAVPLADSPITAEAAGQAMVDIVARALASQVDPDQALRAAVRGLEDQARQVEERYH